MKTKASNTDRWNYVKSFPIEYWKTYLGRKYRMMHLYALVHHEMFTRWRPTARWEMVYRGYAREWNYQRSRFFWRFTRKWFPVLMDRAIKRVIETGDVFVFPKRMAYMCLCVKEDERSLKMFGVMPTMMLYRTPRYRVTGAYLKMVLYNRYKDIIKEQLAKGMVYPSLEQFNDFVREDYYETTIQRDVRYSRDHLGRFIRKIQKQKSRPVNGGELVHEGRERVYQ